MTVLTSYAAIYVTSHVANSQRLKDKLIDLVDQTELNAMVMDINSGSLRCHQPVQSRGMSDIAQFMSLKPANKRSAQHFREVIQHLEATSIFI